MLKSLQTSLDRFPRVDLGSSPTAIERLARLEAALGDQLGGVRLFAKRDDVAGLGGGGNKLRKLEFLLGEAISEGADTFIAIGGRQSNFARLAAAACARVGLGCELVLSQAVPRHDLDYQEGGNILLDQLFGAVIHDLPATDSAAGFAAARADKLRANGRKAFVASVGGSSSTGCLGYVACALEIAGQAHKMGHDFDHIVLANGSGGTHAGLAAGFTAMGRSPEFIRSYAVLAEEVQSRATTIEAARGTLARLDIAQPDEPPIDVRGGERGPGYGIPTSAMIEAVRLMASTEGLLLDPVYSGKAFAGLLQAVRSGEFRPGANVLFVMTGGTPGLFAYRTVFQSPLAG